MLMMVADFKVVFPFLLMVKVTDIFDPQDDVTVLPVTLQVPLQFVVQSALDFFELNAPSELY